MQPAPEAVLRLGNVVLDPAARRVEVEGQDAALTDSEYRLLMVMLRQPGRAFSRAGLLDAGLEDSDALERTVDSHVSHLRAKLRALDANIAINGVRGFGYRLDPA